MIKQILIISNICFEPYLRTFLKERFSCHSDDLIINTILYEDYCENSYIAKCADIVLISLNFDALYPQTSTDIASDNITCEKLEGNCIEKCRELYSWIKSNSSAKIIWLGFEDYCFLYSNIYGSLLVFDGLIDKINLSLNEIVKEAVFLDLKRLIATVGINNSYDAKGKYRWSSPYSKELIGYIADEIYKQYLIAIGSTKKCLVLDCDNVLWGGVLSDDGIEGIEIGSEGLGRSFQDFQRYLLNLYYHGIILAICSKNEEIEVLSVFQKHTGMVLREEHIAFFKCNWDNKPDNIKSIAEYLNIGLDSIVFVDDSPLEIEATKSLLPQVSAILYNRESIYNELIGFNFKSSVDLKTVKERTIGYKKNIQRVELRNCASSYDEYISSLKINIDIHRIMECEYSRASELTQRTNKCTNGVRYTFEQIKKKVCEEQYELYTVCVSDTFSDLGLVGIMGFKGNNVDVFSLSCRALGRKIENKMICWLLEKQINIIRYASTNKNEQLHDLFREYGFTMCP